MTYDKLDVFKDKMFGVWEWNRWVITWTHHIDALHHDDPQFHSMMDCIYLHLVDFIGVLLDAMHDVNM